MPRPRVLSFMTAWSSPNSDLAPNSPTSKVGTSQQESRQTPRQQPPAIDTITPQGVAAKLDALVKGSPTVPQSPGTPSRARGDSRATTRPDSMIQTYQPPQVEVAQDTPPELQPIFSFLNSHSNKLYQEGYFLKLHDLDSRGRPSGDRTWAECFAQLVGTVLSLWDAAALDAAGEDGEVVPTFINLSDASIKMIESLPMSGVQGGNLQNVLSISTAANNRYLLHFNSYNSLTQWTAGIRLAMFEHSTLQEAYTGSLIAGKGRSLNNIKGIMERSKFPHDDWARVRFGAGTPWKRCWCVVTPPDEKQYQKAQKTLKKSAYDRAIKEPKGDIKFYDTRKVTKKTRPIATITDAYAAYAIYPQSKPLIDQSTLVKLEGLVTIHSSPETTTEGFVFVMPEVHAAVTGFEMMLRWLFPVFDTFNLYGRPSKLIADVLDQRGLMFAMPRDRRYGYLDILDVSGLIHAPGSPAWSERQWRRELKKLTSERMTTQMENGSQNLRQMSQRRNTTSRTSLPYGAGGVRFEDGGSDPPSRTTSPMPRNPMMGGVAPPRRTDSAPPVSGMSPHKRSVSDAQGYRKYLSETPSRLSQDNGRPDESEYAPPPPRHGGALGAALGRSHGPGSLERIQSTNEVPQISTTYADPSVPMQPLAPVALPPAFQHNPNSQPANRPAVAPELRRAHSNVDAATLYQMQDASRGDRSPDEEYGNEPRNRVGPTNLADRSVVASADRSQGLVNNNDEYRTPRDPRQRLSTIEGSPYAGGDGEQFQSMSPQSMSQANGFSERLRSREYEQAQRPGPHSAISSHSVSRKPVPKQLPERPRDVSSEIPSPATQLGESDPESRHESFEGGLIDQDALELILSEDRNGTMHSVASTVPDYASTASSDHAPKQPVEKRRAGKLKTVGNPELTPGDPRVGKLDTWQADQAAQNAEMPNIDFGPTYAYKPSSRPGTSGTMTPGGFGDRSRSRSQDRLRSSGRVTPSGISPGENHRHSYFGGGTTPSPGAMTPIEGDNRRHSVAWTPVATSPSATQRQSQTLTPEQWVQHRAAMAAQPQYPPRGSTPTFAHNRVGSGSNIQQMRKSMNKTPPPFGRAQSGDWSQQQGVQTPPSRPNSRGAGTYLNQPNGLLQNTQSANLSAREQMHVARATNTPLLDMATPATQKKHQDLQQPGLVGAIGAREREKAALKAGHRSSMVVENAIRARQQQQVQVEAERQMAAHLQAQQQAAQQAAQVYQFQQQQAQQMMMQQQQQMLAQSPAAGNRQSMYGGSYFGGGAPQQQQPQQQIVTPGYSNPYQQQQQQMMQQQGASTPGNRQSLYGGSHFGGEQQQQQGGQWQGRR